MSLTGNHPVRVRSVVVLTGAAASGSSSADPAGEGGWSEWRRNGLIVRWRARRAEGAASAPTELPVLVLGDASEWSPDDPSAILGGAVVLRWDTQANALVAGTSIVGLPPLFVYRDGSTTVLASDVHLLRGLPGVRLQMDPRSVVELGSIGHPVAHRTLFRRVELAPSGTRLSLSAGGELRHLETWRLPRAEPTTWPDFIERQIGAFQDGVRRQDLNDAFLSLTAGLDTRTVFAALAATDRLIPAATMTGPRRSLDARTAAQLCDAYGVPHHAITFNGDYSRRLPAFLEQASLLSGGLASLDQAPEVFMYERLGDGFAVRLSGNLGNQVGRGGTEGVSTRGALTQILSGDVRAGDAGSSAGGGHWLLEQLGEDQQSTLEFILTREIPFTLVNNYPVGNHYAAQHTPYANRQLIETLASRPREMTGAPSGSKLRMRMRDMAHRFLGERADISFQRTLLQRIGGFAAKYPINWGWRAEGGVSPAGLLMGGATLVGMYARARGLDSRTIGRPLVWAGLPDLHDFRESRTWLRRNLREYTLDRLGSADARASGLFDGAVLGRVLDEHFSGAREHYSTVTYALDLMLAHDQFVAGHGSVRGSR